MSRDPTIACIGWGSLIWSPRGLPSRGDWHEDGPLLPVELARQARDGRITLVLTPGARPVPALWTHLAPTDLDAAREALRSREGIPPSRAREHVGWWTAREHSSGVAASDVATWAAGRGLDGVVWTALPPGFQASPGAIPSPSAVLHYLRGLSGETRRIAEEYIRRAPAQIRTETRSLVERALGWTPDPGDAARGAAPAARETTGDGGPP